MSNWALARQQSGKSPAYIASEASPLRAHSEPCSPVINGFGPMKQQSYGRPQYYLGWANVSRAIHDTVGLVGAPRFLDPHYDVAGTSEPGVGAVTDVSTVVQAGAEGDHLRGWMIWR